MRYLKQLVPPAWRQGIKRRIFAVRDMTTRLQNLSRAGFRCSGAIDGGAYRGAWTREFWSVFPGVPVLLVEPQPHPQEELRALARQVNGSEVLAAALSSASGPASFRLGESNSGLLGPGSDAADVIEVPRIPLDQVLADRPWFHPNLLKLDLQGHELEALRGAGKTLAAFEVVVLEISILRIGDVPIFHEVDQALEAEGYRLYDVIPLVDRPLDGALWQVDAFYVRRDSALVASRSWD